jgi:hypothetical protein
MDKKVFFSVLLLAVTGFLGGVCSDQFLKPMMEEARAQASNTGLSYFFDKQGRKRIDLGVEGVSTIQDFYGVDGKLRLQLATYDGSVRMNEKGLPCFTLYDNSGKLKMVLRLDGPNQGPLLILKDNTGTNRMIMGLDIWDKAEEPFIVTWDKNGKQHDIVGKFVMGPL